MNFRFKFIIAFCMIAGFFAIFFFWPRAVELPKLRVVEAPIFTALDGSDYDLSNDKIKLVTFFYTKCPDVCPLTILDLKNLQEKLKKDGLNDSEYQIILITLDPEVDTVEKITEYKENFRVAASNWFFLRGSTEQTKQITEQFSMFNEKTSDGFITHSTTMYLVDATNTIRSHHDMATNSKAVNLEELVSNIQLLVNEN